MTIQDHAKIFDLSGVRYDVAAHLYRGKGLDFASGNCHNLCFLRIQTQSIPCWPIKDWTQISINLINNWFDTGLLATQVNLSIISINVVSRKKNGGWNIICKKRKQQGPERQHEKASFAKTHCVRSVKYDFIKSTADAEKWKRLLNIWHSKLKFTVSIALETSRRANIFTNLRSDSIDISSVILRRAVVELWPDLKPDNGLVGSSHYRNLPFDP
jgi:hypothetical protein